MKQISRKWLVIVVLCTFWTLLGLSFAGISYSVAESEKRQVTPLIVFVLNLIKFYLWLVFAPLIFVVVKRLSFERRETFFRNFWLQVVAGLVFITVHTAIYTPFVAILDPQIKATLPSISTLFEKYLFFGNFYLNVLLYSILVIIGQGYLFFESYQSERTRRFQLKAELADAQLQALKMQLQPHFLFNTLHSISSLNHSNPQKANAMIARLGDFLRMTLERSNDQMVTLNEELDFLRCYLEIEQIRFSDRLSVEFDIAGKTLSAEVPHLILQPIVENAVKYGIAPHVSPGKIIISSRRIHENLILSVKDSCLKSQSFAVTNGNGNGLKNVQLRLEHLYGGDFRLMFDQKENGTQVELEIPFSVETDVDKDSGFLVQKT